MASLRLLNISWIVDRCDLHDQDILITIQVSIDQHVHLPKTGYDTVVKDMLNMLRDNDGRTTGW